MHAPRLVVAGDPRHGVVRYAALLAGEDALVVPDAAAIPADAGPAHVHFTDRLWGTSPEDAADRFAAVAAVTPVAVTLHDVPQPSDGALNLVRRAAAYARVARAAVGVTVCSHHEASLLAEHVPDAPAPHVIPHALPPFAPPSARPAPDDDVAVLGFLYPGKGHEAVLDAVAALPEPRPVVTALGAPAPGHEADVAELAARAHAAGVTFDVSGHVPDDALTARLRCAGVPVAAHRHLSASGSIASWIAAGRRPLVTDGTYARELAALRPGAVTVVDDLAGAIAAARRDPASTWWDAGADLGPDLAATVAAHRAWWETLPW